MPAAMQVRLRERGDTSAWLPLTFRVASGRRRNLSARAQTWHPPLLPDGEVLARAAPVVPQAIDALGGDSLRQACAGIAPARFQHPTRHRVERGHPQEPCEIRGRVACTG